MKQYYEFKIKPLNDRLGADLGIKKISILAENVEYDIPVKVSFTSKHGSQVTFTNDQLKSFSRVGLEV